MECHNFMRHPLQRKINPERLNNQENLSISVFLLSSHWVRRFFTDHQSVILPSSKVTLPVINVILPTALPMMFDPQWFDSRQLDSQQLDSPQHNSQWFQPTMARPPMARAPMGPTHNYGSTFNGVAPKHQTEARPPPTNGSIKKAKKHQPRDSSLGSVFLLSYLAGLGGFLLINLSIYPFVIITYFKGFFIN